MMKNKALRGKIIAVVAVSLYALFCHLSSIGCPIFYFTKFPCPGCGMTRALLSLLRLDFSQAFQYHPMVWSVPLLLLAFFKDGKLFKRRGFNIAFYLLILAGFLGNWAQNL